MEITKDNIAGILCNLFEKYYFTPPPKNIFQNSKLILDIFETDYNRYFTGNVSVSYLKCFSRIELIGILCYRIANWHYKNGGETVANHFSNLGRIISGFEIYYSAEIGEGMKINHGLGTVIGARCKIGKNLLIHQNVTLGDRKGERPTVLDNVTIYAGAKVLGNVTLGNYSIVAANCVCLTEVPDHGVIMGVPGKLK